MAYNKWKTIKKDQWRYVINTAEPFTTEWHFGDLMPPKLVDKLLGITPEVKENLRIQYRDTFYCPECGASGFSVESNYCPTCGKRLLLDDEEDSNNG